MEKWIEVDKYLISNIKDSIIKLDEFPLNLHDFVAWTRNTKLKKNEYNGLKILINMRTQIEFRKNAAIRVGGYSVSWYNIHPENSILYDVYWLSLFAPCFLNSDVKNLFIKEDKDRIIKFIEDKLIEYGFKTYSGISQRYSGKYNTINFTTKTLKTKNSEIWLNLQKHLYKLSDEIAGFIIEHSDYVLLTNGTIELNDMEVKSKYDKSSKSGKYLPHHAFITFNITFLFMTTEEEPNSGIASYYAPDQIGYYRTKLNTLCSSYSGYDIKQLENWLVELGDNPEGLSKDEMHEKIKYWIDHL